MNFSAWAIRNPIAPILGFALLTIVGIQSFFTLPITRFPNIDVPIVAITVVQSGAAPSELEAQITKEIEDAVAGITGVDDIASTVADNISTTTVIFRMEVPTDQAVQDVKDAIDRVRGDLPASVEEPIVTRVDVEGQAIMTFAVNAPDMTLAEASWFVDDTIKRALQGQPGVGKVDRYGGADREIRIELDPARLDSYGITAANVNQQLRATNADLGGGRGEIGSREQAIRTLGNAEDVEALARTTIALPNGRFVRLSDLGVIHDTYEELRSFGRFNGDQVVAFAVFRSKGASEISVSEVVTEALEEIRADYPNVELVPVDDTVFYTYGNYGSALHTLVEGALLAVLVVFLFLRNWRATLIAAIALPLSAIPTFYVMDLLGFSLNLVSLLAITLATGILVDDAIVEVENISRHIRMGKTPYRAAVEAADEIGLAVIATTFTIIAVFVPVSFMPGIPGQYFIQFGMTVAVAVMFSLLVARLITPMMAAYLMRDSDAHEESEGGGPVMRGYTWFITRTLRWRYTTLLAAIGSLVVAVYFMAQVPGSFLPPEDVSRVSISVELPPGSTLSDTDATTSAMHAIIKDVEGVDSVFILGGTSPKGELDIRRASVSVMLEKIEHSIVKKVVNGLVGAVPFVSDSLPRMEVLGRVRTQGEIETEIFDKLTAIPDIRAYKLNDRGDRDLSYNVISNDDAAIDRAVAILEPKLKAETVLSSVSVSGSLPRPEVQIRPRLDEAARLGVTTAQIAETVRVATIGDVDAALAKISLDNRQIPIRVQLDPVYRTDIDRIGNLRVQTAQGAVVPLKTVADVFITQGPSTINRFNRERQATIGASLPIGVALDTAKQRFNEIVASTELPAGVQVLESGDAEVQNELMDSFLNAMLMGLLLVLTVLILLFKDVIQPFTILFSLPLAIGGVAAGLILTNNSLSMPVLIGILMLMGIVTKNAILLVDFAVELIRSGRDRVEAMIEAGQKRARPIVMTSIAMSAGMLPSALGVGEGGSFRAPMAIAVIGGIIVSTVLSLVVVPSFFLIMDDLSRLLSRIFGRFVGPSEDEPETMEPEAMTAALSENAGEIATLRQRLSDLEGQAGPRPPMLVVSREAAE
ncbi:MAG: efflux RND transporter permease subunit [Hoeflea sp.]|uniref:efflux RND transporter permease subunit n=1 Tax=Hoeflea sp. TaxID=1940281 RepID=UPI001D4B9F9E|nr:efflux RND transporter permease subunit [Hoeflea sp.]MBU4528901.1 efflux RND transporter permease subunit [Alphaproteobacteria bacterium]MBU4544034.1 efflux RND transporter permease subunit [Alphaproteobacteria bacterium]MBU4551903.1 efflux RND transporter permease subunit [Alphaproteobacteria bacterium]MBV1723368.1 efflux RND transporter permease subunit [Hoeflea sp.]MBV1760347.1 efflux RND transporter permease subunit [Hoeflea sp.]